MLRFIYACPLGYILLAIAGLVILWACLYTSRYVRIWQRCNAVLCVAALLAVLYVTVWNRSGGTYAVILRPFEALRQATLQPELYRELLMNVFLFVPLGLGLSNALPRTLKLWMRVGITVLSCFLLSACVEYTQYRFDLGLAETDDVICNTLGGLIGSSSILPAHIIRKGTHARS